MNFTQQLASDAIGCSRDSIKEWEIGVRVIPKHISVACSAVEAGIAAEISKPSELREWRADMGWSKRKAASLIGCNRETLLIWENGPEDKVLPLYIGLACTALKLGIREYVADVSKVVRRLLEAEMRRLSLPGDNES
jgi:DNA-binding XRE family transcriptional regulator